MTTYMGSNVRRDPRLDVVFQSTQLGHAQKSVQCRSGEVDAGSSLIGSVSRMCLYCAVPHSGDELSCVFTDPLKPTEAYTTSASKTCVWVGRALWSFPRDLARSSPQSTGVVNYRCSGGQIADYSEVRPC